MITTSSGNTHITDQTAVEEPHALGPWDEAVDQLRQWEPAWVETCVRMTTSPWTAGVLSRKFIELVGIGLNAACTNLNPDGTRRHIRAALATGATRTEILLVLKCASVMSIHLCSLGAPILLEEAKAAGVEPTTRTSKATPARDRVKEVGQWNVAWDPFYALDPVWTDEFMATGIGIYTSDALTPKEVELLSIALDASYTHMYAPGILPAIGGLLLEEVRPRHLVEMIRALRNSGKLAPKSSRRSSATRRSLTFSSGTFQRS